MIGVGSDFVEKKQSFGKKRGVALPRVRNNNKTWAVEKEKEKHKNKKRREEEKNQKAKTLSPKIVSFESQI